MPTAYPSIPRRTRVRPLDETVRTDESDAGEIRAVDLGAAVLYRLEISHPLMSAAELTTLTTFWAANKGGVVTISAPDGSSYNCLLLGEPEIEIISRLRTSATVNLEGNRE